MNSNKSCILFFSQDAALSAAGTKKNLLHRSKNRKRLFQKLKTDTLKTLEQTRLDIVTVGTDDQYGASFGQRLSNAISDTFLLGYESLIVVGDDCPQLSKKLILQAAQDLSTHQLVLGPAQDGGVYMIGLHRAAFDPAAFKAMRWESHVLLSDLMRYCRDLDLNNIQYEVLKDIDKASDLASFRLFARCNAMSIQTQFLLFILQLVASECLRGFQCTLVFQSHLLNAFKPLRAPPY